jgi:hypothetical protein
VLDQLRAERDAARAEVVAMRRSIERLTEAMAGQNDKVDQLLAMLRRREAELKRLERENRKLRRKLGLDPEPDPEPDPVPDAMAVPDEAKPSEESGDAGAASSLEDGDASDSSAEGSHDPASTSSTATPKSRPRSRGGRRPPPAHLPTGVETYEVCACGVCGGHVFKRDVLEVAVYSVVPSYVRCRKIRRERVICADPDCGAPTTATMPPMPCPRALYDCAFLAWLVVMKFVLLVPLDRVRTYLLSQGIDLAMGTLVHLITRAAGLADAVDGEHWRQLLAGEYLGFDGTGLKVLIDGQDKAWDGYLEVFTRDELTVFQFDLTKHADRLRDRLAPFEGIVVCDAESRNAAGTPGRQASNCNAHPLRKLKDAKKVQPHLAAQGQRFIDALYELEDLAREQGLEGDDLVAFRRRRSRRVLHRFRQWLEGVKRRALPPSDPVRKVANYYLRHFEDLTRFVDHAFLPLDNNGAEREFQRHAGPRSLCVTSGNIDEQWFLGGGINPTRAAA